MVWRYGTQRLRRLLNNLFYIQPHDDKTMLLSVGDRSVLCGVRGGQSHLNKVAMRLNQRPRKTLGFETPVDRLRAVLH